jgi:ANTAR domain
MARLMTIRPTTAPTPTSLATKGELDALRRENEALRRALEACKVVERAKAILMTEDGFTESGAHRYIQKSSMDTRVPMAEVARGFILGTQARRRPVTTAQVRRSPWPVATPRADSFPGAFGRWQGLGSRPRTARAHDSGKRPFGSWPPSAGRP